MRIFNNNKFQRVFMTIIILLAIIELYAIYKLSVIYKGIHLVYCLVPLVIVQMTIWYGLVFKKDNIKRYKSGVVIIVIITVSIPVLMLVTQPEYSYEDGKVIVENNIRKELNYDFIEYPDGKNTIPVSDNPKRILINNRNYYYRLSDGMSTLFFTVNPINGKVGKLDNGFWEEGVDN